jgi:hypothetical protein
MRLYQSQGHTLLDRASQGYPPRLAQDHTFGILTSDTFPLSIVRIRGPEGIRITAMPTLDPTDNRSARETSALLREARSLLRRADKLFAATAAMDDRGATGLATEVRTAIEQLVHYLTRVEQQRERRAREALRRGR